MELAEKIKTLREVEGTLRGLNRPMSQMEVVKAMQEELGESISQAYLSQLESGKRVQLTISSRHLLSRFFKVLPGYLVSDPPDYNPDLLINIQNGIDHLKSWLEASAVEWRFEPDIRDLFECLANVEDPRSYLSIFRELMDLSIEELKVILRQINHNDGYG